MGFLEDLLCGNTMEAELSRQYDFQLMAAQRMAHGLEPIDWETILRNQAQATGALKEKRRVKHVESWVIENITGVKAK